MDSSPNPSLLQAEDDRLSSIRKRDKIIIFTFFALIFLLALTIGAIIISLVFKINSKLLYSNRAVREFCSPLEFRPSCISALSSAIRAPSNTNPNHIFVLTLQSSLTKISNIIDETRSQQEFVKCSSLLRHAMSQLNNVMEIVRIDPDVQTYERGNMTAWIDAAEEEVEACVGELGEVESMVRTKAVEVAELVGYSRDILVNCEAVNEEFRWSPFEERNSGDKIVEDLIAVSLFGLQYLVLVFLFCLLRRLC